MAAQNVTCHSDLAQADDRKARATRIGVERNRIRKEAANKAFALNRPLPMSMYLHHGSYWFKPYVDGCYENMNFGRDLKVALEKHREYVERNRTHAYMMKALYLTDTQLVGTIPIAYLKQMLVTIKKRARSRGLECALTNDTMLALARRAKGRCELSGIPFDVGFDGRAKRIWAPSVDRIRCSEGYTLENVRLLCVAVNLALQDFGDEAFLRIAQGVTEMVKTRIKEQ